MKAVFSENPYKFWTYGAVGELHLFDDNVDFELFTSACPDWFTTSDPNEIEEAETWAKLVYDYLSCGGTAVLHVFTDEYDKFEEELVTSGYLGDLIGNGKAGWEIGFIPGHGGRWASMMVRIRFAGKSGEDEVNPVELMRLLHDVYDVAPFELWESRSDSNGNYRSVYANDVLFMEDILSAAVIKRYETDAKDAESYVA